MAVMVFIFWVFEAVACCSHGKLSQSLVAGRSSRVRLGGWVQRVECSPAATATATALVCAHSEPDYVALVG